jgi:hypothetical protein
MLARFINFFADVSAKLFYSLEPCGFLIFWILSLASILHLMLRLRQPGRPEKSSPDDRGSRFAWLEWTLVGAFTFLGAAIRLYGIGRLPYWWDEILAVWIAGSDIPTLLRTLGTPSAPASDFTPPLFYLVFHYWQGFFGQQEAASRILTGIFSVLAIPAIHLLGKRLMSVGAGLGAAFLLAVSFNAVSYSQQVRSYSLLALLAILFLLSAEALFRKFSRRNITVFVVVGTLFLYTHFVAAWLYAGIVAAYLITLSAKALAARLTPAGARGFETTRCACLCLAGFALAAFCPLFKIPAALAGRETVFIFCGLALLAATLLAGLGTMARDRSGPGRPFVFLAVLFLPGVLFAPWVLHTRIWEVIAGAGAYRPGSYGLKELQNTFDAFCSLEAQYTLYLFLFGLFSLLARRPRAALVVCGWVIVPAVLAMCSQNRNMNLVRYLFATQAGYPLLISIAAMEILGIAWSAARWGADHLPFPSLRVRSKSVLAEAPPGAALPGMVNSLVLICLFGFICLSRISFPTQTLPSEDYPGVAAALAKAPDSCLGFENENMLRGISWFLTRLNVQNVTCGRDSPKLFLLNAYDDGRPWSGGSAYVAWLHENAQLVETFPGIQIFRASGTVPLSAETVGDNVTCRITGRDLLLGMEQGQGIGYADGAVHPLKKKVSGLCRYVVGMPDIFAGSMKISFKGLAVGPHSKVVVRAGDQETEAAVEVTLGGDGTRIAQSPGSDPGKYRQCAVQNDTAACWFPVPMHFGPGKPLVVELELFDDGSGAIYSSNVGLSELQVSLATATAAP